MNEKPFQIPAQMIGYKSMVAGSVRINFETQENLSTEMLTNMLKYTGKVGNLLFAVEQLELDNLIDLPKIDGKKYVEKKSPSQRLRAALWLYHTQEGGNEKTFDAYYEKAMESFINSVQNKLL